MVLPCFCVFKTLKDVRPGAKGRDMTSCGFNIK